MTNSLLKPSSQENLYYVKISGGEKIWINEDQKNKLQELLARLSAAHELNTMILVEGIQINARSIIGVFPVEMEP